MDVTRLEVVVVVNTKFGLGHSLGHMQALVGRSFRREGTASMDHGCFRHAVRTSDSDCSTDLTSASWFMGDPAVSLTLMVNHHVAGKATNSGCSLLCKFSKNCYKFVVYYCEYHGTQYRVAMEHRAEEAFFFSQECC